MSGRPGVPNAGPAADARAAAADLLGARLGEVSRLLRKASGGGEHAARLVHQLRVSTRRAGAALRVFGTLVGADASASARARLRRIRKRAAAARKCDALRGVLRPLMKDMGGDERRAAARVMNRLADRRRKARRGLRELPERWGRKRMRRWRRSVVASCRGAERGAPDEDCSLSDLAPVALGELIDSLHGAGSGVGSAESLHRLRLAGKRVRYAVEALAPALDEAAAAEAISHLAALQERLGDINDLTDLLAEVAAVRDRWERRGACGRASGAAALAQRLSDRRESSRREFLAWWEEGARRALRSRLGMLARPGHAATGRGPARRDVMGAIEPARELNGAGA